MRFIDRDLTNQFISESTQRVVQQYIPTGSVLYLLDGYGYSIFSFLSTSYGQRIITSDVTSSMSVLSAFIATTASYSIFAETADSASTSILSNFATTSSYALKSKNSDTSSLTTTSSFAITASFAMNGGGSGTTLATGSTVPITSSWAITASFALISPGAGTTLFTGSTYPITASWAVTASNAVTSSFAITASSLPGLLFSNASILTSTTQSDIVVIQRPTGSLNAAFFDFVVMSGSNSKAGTIFGNWITNSISYTQFVTTDIGNTSQVTLSLFLTASNVQLLANASTTLNWMVKSVGRYI